MSKIATYPSADTPLQLSDRLIGTEAIRTPPTSTPLATKNFSLGELLQLFSANFPAASLQAVLNTGNTATQNITLTGTITTTVIKPNNIEDTSGSQGTVFQYLSKGTSSINWVNLPIDTLQAVLNAGNIATQNITLVGNITSTRIIPGNIQDDTGGIGIIGQVLSKTATGIRWINSPSAVTPGLADVLSVGNTATNDITLIGDINASNAKITGAFYDSNNSPGTLGQVLSSKGTQTDWIDVGTVTSIGMTVPSAFNVTPSTITSSGTFAITGAGISSQYIRGDGTLATFPTSTGGGSSFNYYLNGSISQGTFGGTPYYQMSRTPVFGVGTNFTRTNGAGNGYIASFITDAGDPSQLNIPGGNWNVEFYFNASSGGGSPSFYAELYKVDATNVFTLIASDSLNPEGITNGTVVDQYFTSIPVPQTTLLITDRLAVRIFVNTGGRTITLHTENSNLSEVLTTFSTGLTALNGLTQQVQYFSVGTSGTDFNISSVTDTHTFNLPTASAVNRGALSSTDWNTFNGKFTLPSFTSGSVLFSNGTTIAQDNANFFWDDTNNRLGIGTATPTRTLDVVGLARISGQIETQKITNLSTVSNVPADASLLLYAPTTTNYYGGIIGWAESNIAASISSYDDGSGGALGLALSTGNATSISEKMRITSTGNVGIGDTIPSDKLVVNGRARINGTNALAFGNNAGGYAQIAVSGATTGNLLFSTYDGAALGERMRITTTGNVGIGTTNPAAILQINAQGALSTDIAFRVRNSADTRDFLIVNGTGDVYNNGAGGVNTSTIFGENSGRNSSVGSNTFFGYFAGNSATSGGSNTAIGRDSLSLNTTGAANTSIGTFSLLSIIGTNNIGIGFNAGRFIADGATSLTTSGESIFIGNGSRANGNGENNQIVIGHNAIGLGSNTVVLGNSSILTTALRGNVGIGATTANARLDVRAQGALTTDIALKVRNSVDTADLFNVNGAGQVNGVSFNATNAVMTTRGGKADLYGFTGPTLSYYNGVAIVPALTVIDTGSILIGTSGPAASAKLDVFSTTQGFLPPRMTTTQRNAIVTPATGLIVYDNTLLSLYQFNGTAWVAVGAGGGSTKSINSVSTNTAAGSSASTDYFYFASGTINITLPTAVGNNNYYTIKNVGTGTITIDTTSSQTIDGSLTAPIKVQYLSLTLISDGANWNII